MQEIPEDFCQNIHLYSMDDICGAFSNLKATEELNKIWKTYFPYKQNTFI